MDNTAGGHLTVDLDSAGLARLGHVYNYGIAHCGKVFMIALR